MEGGRKLKGMSVKLFTLSPVVALQCGAPFKSEDVSIINGTEEDIKRQKEIMEEKRLQARQAKLAKVNPLAKAYSYYSTYRK